MPSKPWSPKEREYTDTANKAVFETAKRFVEAYEKDEEQSFRRRNHICRHCYYKITGSFPAVTEGNCGRCGDEITSMTTSVPTLCDNCAVETGSCAKCGGTMD